MIEVFGGRKYRKLSGRRYDYWLSHTEQTDGNRIICSLEGFARMAALSVAAEDDSFLHDMESVEEAASAIMDEWPVDELLAAGTQFLPEFNKLGLKHEDTVEGN